MPGNVCCARPLARAELIATRRCFDLPTSEQAAVIRYDPLQRIRPTIIGHRLHAAERVETMPGWDDWLITRSLCTACNVWSLLHEILGLCCRLCAEVPGTVCLVCRPIHFTQWTQRLVCTRHLLPRVMDSWTRWSKKPKVHKVLHCSFMTAL